MKSVDIYIHMYMQDITLWDATYNWLCHYIMNWKNTSNGISSYTYMHELFYVYMIGASIRLFILLVDNYLSMFFLNFIFFFHTNLACKVTYYFCMHL